MAYLCGRPLPNRGRCVLGRETAIQKMVWSPDGWLRTDDGEGVPQVSVPAPNLPSHPFPAPPRARISIRRNCPSIFSGCARPIPSGSGALRSGPGFCASSAEKPWGASSSRRWSLAGSRPIASRPPRAWSSSREHFQQAAGLILYYNATKFHYLFLTEDETIGRHFRVMSCVTDIGDSFSAPIPLPAGTGNIELRMDVDYERLIFAYRLPEKSGGCCRRFLMRASSPTKRVRQHLPNFTGSFVGVCCQDGAGTRRPADFDYFEYHEREYQPQLTI